MPNSSSKRTERLQVMISEDELKALDDWRFKAHMPSRAAAVRELLKRGLAAEGYFSIAGGGSASKDFGVISANPNRPPQTNRPVGWVKPRHALLKYRIPSGERPRVL